MRTVLLSCCLAALVGATPSPAQVAQITPVAPSRELTPGGMRLARIALSVCNDGPTEADFEFSLAGPPGVTFDPPTGVMRVGSGDCDDGPVDILIDPAVPGAPAIVATVVNTATGALFDLPATIKPVQNFTVTPVDLVVSTESSTAELVLQVTNRSVAIDHVVVSFTLPAPMTPPAPVDVLVPPGGTKYLRIAITEEGVEKTAAGLWWDDDDDSDIIPVEYASALIRFDGPACPTDLNADGLVNGADLGLLLGAWGACP